MYSALPHPLQAFASDVRYAASLLQAGCNKTNSLFAQEYSEKREWWGQVVIGLLQLYWKALFAQKYSEKREWVGMVDAWFATAALESCCGLHRSTASSMS